MKLIITDLDGTLFDYHTYSFEAAQPALDRIRQLSIPLILCSSKTGGEIALICKKLGMKLPFIAENGGAIYLPKGFLSGDFEETFLLNSEDEEYVIMEMGTGRDKLTEVFQEVRELNGAGIKSFSDMSLEEVMEHTSLPENEARLAMERRFTEPFLFLSQDESYKSEVIKQFADRGLTTVKGGRFYHLMGDISKGKAVSRIKEIFSRISGNEITSMGLGDSENDISMLSAVERPVIVRKWDGSWMEAHGTEDFERTEGIGPVGWNEAVLSFLDSRLQVSDPWIKGG